MLGVALDRRQAAAADGIVQLDGVHVEIGAELAKLEQRRGGDRALHQIALDVDADAEQDQHRPERQRDAHRELDVADPEPFGMRWVRMRRMR